MSWNGAGVFNRLYNWVNDKNAAINITASRMDADANDITANGLGNCITRDGQGQPSGNLPMATFRHTNVADGVSRTDYASLGQSQDGKINWVAAGGSADALAATYIPALTALVDGQLCFLRAVAANATTTPTFAPNGLTAHTITKIGGAPLAAADINATGHEIILRYNLANTRWELLNPAAPIVYSNDAGAGVGPSLDLFRDSASPAVSDFIGSLDFNGRDSGAAKQLYAQILTQITDPTAASEDAILILRAVVGGVLTDMLKSSAAGITIPGSLSLPSITTPLQIPGSTTANRNGSPTAGDIRYNTTLAGLEYWNGTVWIVLGQQPTVQSFTSVTSGTYSLPAGVVRVRVRISAGGGGGGGGTANNGANGTSTTFGSWGAVQGAGGAFGGGAGGQGGAGGGTGAGTQIARFIGGDGNAGGSGSTNNIPGGAGGSNPLGGAGAAARAGAGGNAKANTGGGGAGAGSTNTASSMGAGGGAGEYVEFWMTAAQASGAAWAVGGGGAGGAAGTLAGGNGASGGIIVEEFYS